MFEDVVAAFGNGKKKDGKMEIVVRLFSNNEKERDLPFYGF